MEIGNPEEIQKYEETFAEEIKTRGPDFKYFQDQGRAQSELCCHDMKPLHSPTKCFIATSKLPLEQIFSKF